MPPTPRQETTTAGQGRAFRSRLDRPCDLCRKHKHICLIPIRHEPCVSCKARGKDCTFSMPPSTRRKNPRPGPSAASSRSTKAPSRSNDAFAIPNVIGGNDETTTNSSLASVQIIQTVPLPGIQVDVPQIGMQAGAFQTEPAFSNMPSVSSELPSTQAQARVLQFDSFDPLLSDTATAVHSDGDHDEPIAHPPSLDLDDGDTEESHFIGSEAFFSLLLRSGEEEEADPTPIASLSFRQVSSDPRLPAYFMKHPSLVYGRGPNSPPIVFEEVQKICTSIGDEILSKALSSFQRITLPAMPFIHSKRLETACLGLQDSGPVPYALLAGIVAHATTYVPDISHLHQTLWAKALTGIEEEYHQPRLRTIQLALLVFTSRPVRNAGQAGVGLTRAIGAAQLLGLHIDPSNWKLPRWEKGVRKRMWWTLMIHDKWRALLYGRPSNIHQENSNVPLPTVEDGDWGNYVGPSEKLSLESFIATCRLTLIVDKLLSCCYTVNAILNVPPGIRRLAELEDIRTQIESFEASLPDALLWQGRASNTFTTIPTGIRSCQLSYLGLSVVVNQHILREVSSRKGTVSSLAVTIALASGQKMVEFVSQITPSEQQLFWIPYTSHHLSNCLNLLLRIALAWSPKNDDVSNTAISSALTLIDVLLKAMQSGVWDCAEAALRRSAPVLVLASRDLFSLHEASNTVATALHLPPLDNSGLSTNQASNTAIAGNSITFDWLEMDCHWFDTGALDLLSLSNSLFPAPTAEL